jgi:O-antigen/teichoic acid export membrane protein
MIVRSARERCGRLGIVRSMRHSVIRRSLYTGVFFVAGHAFYYLLVITANGRLDPAGFGRFYLGWAILNVLVAPGGVLALALSGHFADAYRLGGAKGTAAALRRAATTLLPWALALAFAAEAILMLGGKALGADSFIMIALLPLTALASVAVDTVRATFLGMLRFVLYGASWLLWCFGQLGLGAAGLLIFRAAWAVFLGMLTANCITLAILLAAVWRMRGTDLRTGAQHDAKRRALAQSFRALLPLCAALGGFVLLSNADVLIAYIKLSAAELGTYSASAVLPKAIVTATHAISLVILPVATHIRAESVSVRPALAKAMGLTFALAALGALALWLVRGEACGGRFGIKFCDPALLLWLAVAAIAVSVARTAIIADVLGGRRWRPQLPVAAAALFAAATWLGAPDGMRLAIFYAVLCWLLLGALALAKLAERRTPTSAAAAVKANSP